MKRKILLTKLKIYQFLTTGSSTASLSTSPHMTPRNPTQSTLHELLMRKGENPKSPMRTQIDPVLVVGGKPRTSRLSMSAPTQSMGLEQIWARREPRQHLLSTGSLGLAEAGSTSSLSTGGALSPDPLSHHDPFSHDEGYEDSDDDSDHYDDYSSDNGKGLNNSILSMRIFDTIVFSKFQTRVVATRRIREV